MACLSSCGLSEQHIMKKREPEMQWHICPGFFWESALVPLSNYDQFHAIEKSNWLWKSMLEIHPRDTPAAGVSIELYFMQYDFPLC